jgi:hypothetical protein
VPEKRHYARLDSGAEATLIRESTATSLNYEPQAAPPTEIVFGNGESTVTDRSVDIGSSSRDFSARTTSSPKTCCLSTLS